MRQKVKRRIAGAGILALLLASPLLFDSCIQLPKTTAQDPSLPRTVLDGYPFHTEEYGKEDAPVVIVVHGGPGIDFSYLYPLRELSDAYRVIFYDQRGTGLSPRESMDKKQNMEQFFDEVLQDLHAMVLHYGKGKPVRLIGHSWGGMVVAGYLGRYGDTVKSAVIAEPGVLTPETAKIFVAKIKENQSFWQMVGFVPDFVASLFVKSRDGQEKGDYVMTHMMGSGEGAPYHCEGDSLPKNSFRRAGYQMFRKNMMPMIDDPSLFNVDLTKGLKEYRGRILYMNSECSFIGYDYQKKYHFRYFPAGTEYVKMPHIGHNMLTIRPEASISKINEFFAEK